MPLTHSFRELLDPMGWVLYLAHQPPSRLVVFVHGFSGGTVSSWQRFPSTDRAWWSESDMLFVGYDSRIDSITGTSARLRRNLPRFFPHLPSELLESGNALVRATDDEPYRELFLVGHSLGGVILRRAVCDLAHDWLVQLELDEQTPRPPLLTGSLLLFSPASAGFRAAGILGIIRATPAWYGINLYLRRSSAYSDLQPGSPILTETRRRTEELVSSHKADLSALRARILWANPEDVVVPERYDSDLGDDAVDGTTHQSVCKPSSTYVAPWLMVESGRAL